MLTIEEVKENPALMDKFIKQSKGLILNIIKKNFTSALNRDELDDIIQEANLALYKAMMKFDVDKGFKFSTYAVNTIIGSIKNYYRSGFDNLGLSVKVDMRLQWRKYNFLNSRGFTDEEIAKKMEISYEDLLELQRNMRAVTSLDSLLTDEEMGANIYDILPSEYNLQEEAEHKNEISNKAFLIRKYLSDKHYRAIMLRLNDISHKEIAKELGIRNIQERTLFNDIKENFEYITQYYDGLITSNELINKININGKSDIMPKNNKKMKYDDVVKAITVWAINNPGESITRKCISSDVDIVGGSFGDAKMNALQLLRSQGYTIQQHGVTFRLIENVLEHEDEEIDHQEKYNETLRTIDVKDLSDFMTDLVAGMSASHDKIASLIGQFRDNYNKDCLLSIRDKEYTPRTAKGLVKTIEQVINLAELEGKKVQATILINEIN